MLFNWKYFFFVGLIMISSPLARTQSYSECSTPNFHTGTCKPLEECAQIYNKLQTAPITPAERDYLRRSQCGYLFGKIFICCPDIPAVAQPDQISATHSDGASLLPRPPNCGNSLGDRIVYGELTSLFEYPWAALLEYTKPGNLKGHHCGGSLINDRYVLTAAHCVTGSILGDWHLTGVRLGEWDTETNPDCKRFRNGREECASPHVDVAIEEIIPHPQYVSTSRGQNNDIALLRLRNKVTFTKSIEPICLPLMPELRNSDFENRKADVVGWGQTENSTKSTQKLKATLNIADFNTCKKTYASQNVVLQSTQICAGGTGKTDSCHGDSGGGLITTETVGNSIYFNLAGVVSFGRTQCGIQNWPGVYTRVGFYIGWIQDTIRS